MTHKKLYKKYLDLNITIQSKVFAILFLLVVLMSINLYENYSSQKKRYNDLMKYTINSTIEKIKVNTKEFDSIESMIQQYYALVKRTHAIALDTLKKDKNTDLKTLKEKLDKQLPLSKIFTHIYIIDANNTTQKTTLKDDLYLNLTSLPYYKQRVKYLLDNKDEILIDNVSMDIYSKDYNIHSYSILDANKSSILKISYYNSFIGKIKKILYTYQADNSILDNIEVFENHKNYTINLSNTKKPKNISKQDYISKVMKDNSKEIQIIKKVAKNKSSHSYYKTIKDKEYLISYIYIDSVKTFQDNYKNYVLKTKIDITPYKKNLSELRGLFYLTLFFSIFLVIFFLFYIRTSIFKPFNEILQKSSSQEIIQNKNLLNKKDEFSQLSNNINAISSELNLSKQEIYEKNRQLKISNEKLKEFNENLQHKVDEEVQKNLQKDKQLMQQSKLAQMGETINMIAHQWRQPLGSISSAIVGAKMKIYSNRYDLDDKNQREEFLKYLDSKHDAINSYAKFLSSTIDDFRNFFKPDKEKELSQIDSIIDKTLDMSNTYMAKANIKIQQTDISDASVFVYKNQIMQVILNILHNCKDNFALKNIENAQINICTKEKDSEIIICICDNGGGISKDVLPHIFEPYFSTKDQKNNTGIGLYMSKIIIEEHNGGKLEAYNKENGVCFEIHLALS